MKRLIAISATVLAGLSLAACSSGGSQSGDSNAEQTPEQACAVIDASLTKLEGELAEMNGDSPEAMGEMVILAKNSLGELDKELTNQEVREAWQPIADLQIKGLEAASEEDTDALMAAYTELGEHAEAFNEVCPVELPQS